MLKFLLKYEIVHNKVYNTVSVRSLMPIIQHTLYNAISQKPLQEAGGGRKILELFLPIWRQFENNFLLQFDDNWFDFDFFILLNCDWAQFQPPHFGCFGCSNRYNHA